MEIVLSGENKYDDYGNFRFKDKDDKEHKIGTKRENFDDLVSLVMENPGRAVKLVMDTYKNRSYIVGIELLDKQIQVGETVITKQQVAPTAPKPASKPEPQVDPKNRSFGLSYAKDVACAKIQMGGNISPREILGIAEMFTVYLDKGMPEEALKAYNQIQKQLKGEE